MSSHRSNVCKLAPTASTTVFAALATSGNVATAPHRTVGRGNSRTVSSRVELVPGAALANRASRLNHSAARGDHRHRPDVFLGRAVLERAHPAPSGGRHPADARVRARVRPEKQPVRLQERVELVLQDARADDRELLPGNHSRRLQKARGEGRGVGAERRRQKSLRIGVHHADAVVWEPVRYCNGTRLQKARVQHEPAVVRHAPALQSRPGASRDDGHAPLVTQPHDLRRLRGAAG
eukprot:29225-Pelagococcus_subviridis.AAC.4